MSESNVLLPTINVAIFSISCLVVKSNIIDASVNLLRQNNSIGTNDVLHIHHLLTMQSLSWLINHFKENDKISILLTKPIGIELV
jgi:hypothetical protein